MLDCTRRHLKTNKLKTALFKLLQGGPCTDSPGVMEPVWRGTQSLTVHHEMYGQRMSSLFASHRRTS